MPWLAGNGAGSAKLCPFSAGSTRSAGSAPLWQARQKAPLVGAYGAAAGQAQKPLCARQSVVPAGPWQSPQESSESTASSSAIARFRRVEWCAAGSICAAAWQAKHQSS